MLNASSETGLFSESYDKHSSIVWMNEEDMRALSLQDNHAVKCQGPGSKASIILVARGNKHVLAGTVHIMESPRIQWGLGGILNRQDVNIEKSNEIPAKIRALFEQTTRAS